MKVFSLTALIALVFALCLLAFGSPLPASTTVAGAGAAAANELYLKNCARCHGNDGRAKGLKAKAVGARNLTDSEWHERVSDERIFNSISNGKGKMPAYGKKLSEAEINSLVNYVRSIKR